MSDGRFRTDPEVPRFAHGSRVPGWDRAVDLEKDPEEIPDPATTPVPDGLRAEVEEYMGRYPQTRSAAIPALRAQVASSGFMGECWLLDEGEFVIL